MQDTRWIIHTNSIATHRAYRKAVGYALRTPNFQQLTPASKPRYITPTHGPGTARLKTALPCWIPMGSDHSG
jgi:hypothetical protein